MLEWKPPAAFERSFSAKLEHFQPVSPLETRVKCHTSHGEHEAKTRSSVARGMAAAGRKWFVRRMEMSAAPSSATMKSVADADSAVNAGEQRLPFCHETRPGSSLLVASLAGREEWVTET